MTRENEERKKSENKEKKRFLIRYRFGVIKLKEISAEIDALRLGALPGGISYDGMPHGSGNMTDLSDYVADIDELITLYKETAGKNLRDLKQITRAIEAVEDPRCNILLRYRYIQLKDWAFIADRMGYSEIHVRGKLHSLALNAFKIPDEE